MTPQEQAYLRILKIINDDPRISQRQLADRVGVSVGKADYLLKTLIEKGQIRINNFKRSESNLKYVYLLTPKWFRERARLTRACLIEALFPRYLFMRVESNECCIAPVRSTRGVCDLVRFGLRAAVVSDEIIDAIRGRDEAVIGMHIDGPSKFSGGEAVKLAEGPLAGGEGIFSKQSSGERVPILLEILGKASNVVVPREWIEKVKYS